MQPRSTRKARIVLWILKRCILEQIEGTSIYMYQAITFWKLKILREVVSPKVSTLDMSLRDHKSHTSAITHLNIWINWNSNFDKTHAYRVLSFSFTRYINEEWVEKIVPDVKGKSVAHIGKKNFEDTKFQVFNLTLRSNNNFW